MMKVMLKMMERKEEDEERKINKLVVDDLM